MRWTNLRFVNMALLLAVLLVIPALSAKAGGSRDASNSEVVVQRVDNNSLIRLRIYIDAKVAGSLRVGETSVYKITNGPHTIRAAFEDYQARSTEVTQFTANNSRILFTVTDESIVAIGQESLRSEAIESIASSSMPEDTTTPTLNIETSVRNSFDRATKSLKKKSKVAIINVDSDNVGEGEYVLEELTYLTVHSSKDFYVIDRRTVDAFRASNGLGVPSYNNDYILMLIGQLIGADIVLSGRLDGPGELRRLRVKALDVKTGRLVGDSSERV